jgi:hypothetical protein
VTDHEDATELGVWLLEQYEPGASVRQLHQRVRALAVAVAARSGTARAVRLIAGTVLPDDEEALCLLEAESAQAIRVICRKSRFRVDRLVRVDLVRSMATEDF